ncbi:MAG: hypothetical protein QF411_11105, partial [Planctomycetota bacterium]|nr:hypothetical protein [Planctomycetota bacterium]
WSLMLGPGEQLSSLRPLLDALLPTPCRPLPDLLDILGEPATSGRLLLDGETFPAEDLGLLRRILERLPAWDLVLFGGPSPPPSLAPWITPPRVRWVQWPPDVEQLRAFARPGPAQAGLAPMPPAAAPAPATLDDGSHAELQDLDPDLTVAEGAGSEPADVEFDENSNGDSDSELAAIAAILGNADQIQLQATAPAIPADRPILPPAWYRDQVADLADLAQGLELSSLALGESISKKAREGAGFQHLQGDLARLIQFTRTVGYIAAPPARGNQVLGLGTLLEEVLAQMPRPSEDGPRFLYRSRSTLPIRSDKTLLTQALDALLHVARQCAGAGEIVRVSVTTVPAPDDASGQAPDALPAETVTIDFPAGPLRDLPLERAFQPYGLRGCLPDLGPNAILAAAGICRGQGGDLALEEGLPGRRLWTVTLPAAPDAAPGADS